MSPELIFFYIKPLECFPAIYILVVFYSSSIGQTAVVSPRELTATELNGIELELF
jgi:hypothetical protein